VRLELALYRLRCRNPSCGRKTFAEPLGSVAERFARRTNRVQELARLVGHAAGGLPAERLMARLGLPQSDDTILRHLKHHMAAQGRGENARIIGIDDWAWRKGSTYGTIIVDLSQRRVLDIMQNRSAATTFINMGCWMNGEPQLKYREVCIAQVGENPIVDNGIRPPSMSAMSQCSNALTCEICVRVLARLKGFFPIPARPVKPVPNPTIGRPGAICSSVAMAEAWTIAWR
jgi:hypothetical protein